MSCGRAKRVFRKGGGFESLGGRGGGVGMVAWGGGGGGGGVERETAAA